MEKAVIFGAGAWGDVAYHYCKKKYDLVAYIDNNSKIWNTYMNGLPIKSPDILKDNKFIVILANLKYEKSIKAQLVKDYDIRYVLKFNVDIGIEETEESDVQRELIMSFFGGLGNQMFEYALYKMLELNGKNIRADILNYYLPNSREFELTSVFPRTKVYKANTTNIRKYKLLAPYMKDEVGFQYYLEANVMDNIKSFADKRLLDNDLEWGYLRGYFQTRVFAQQIENILKDEFIFCDNQDKKLIKLIKDIQSKNVISVHIRRGDYLDNSEWYGGICTKEYYDTAMKEIKGKVENPIFCFFSDDIEWVKDNFIVKNAIYIEPDMFEDYQDWYDMYLMSECKHNIIANSSFSWWGAWLNKNKNKIVIAPKKWINADSMEDICPEDWARI